MSAISTWSTTAASNNSSPPDGAPEGMAPSTVNNIIREVMAQVRTWYDDAQWIDLGDSPTQASSTTFTISGDVTATYHVGRRIKCTDSSTLYGTITASSYGAPNTTVTVALDSGSLTGSLSAVALGIITHNNTSFPGSGIKILGNAPYVEFIENDVTADNKKWRIVVDGEKFRIDTIDDTETVYEAAIEIDRTDEVIDTVNFPNGTLQYGGIEVKRSVTGTATATTSGTAHDYTSIPSWVKKITIIFNGVSLSSNGFILVQIGDSGGVETSGYASNSARVLISSTATSGDSNELSGFAVSVDGASEAFTGHMVLTNISGNIWISSHHGATEDVGIFGGGSKTLSGTLDRVRITRAGSDTFDGGSVNIMYE